MTAIDTSSVVAAGRLAHEQLMTDACTITRPGAPVLDRATSALTPGTALTLYTGPCRVKAQRMPRPAQAGEELAVVARYEIALPFSIQPASPLQVGDIVTVTASADGRLTGQHLAVLAVDFGSTTTAWRIATQHTT